MRITTLIKLDMLTGKILEHRYFEYEGEVLLCKGDDTAKQAEQQQLQFNTQLMSIFGQQFSKQDKLLTYLQAKLQPMIDNPTGYSPSELAALRTSASDQLSTQYNNAEAALRNKQIQLGGNDLPSGVNAQQLSALTSAEATDKANAQNQITQANENLKQQNYWNALGVLSGNIVNSQNPLGYAGAATSGSNAVAGLSQAVTASNQSQLLGALGGIAGGVGTALSGPLGSKLFCWVASVCFGGFYEPRTIRVRHYLMNVYSETFVGKFVVNAYAKYGETLANLAVMYPSLQTPLKVLFNYALYKA